MMAGIKGKNTRPEMAVRRGLFARGFRYRVHVIALAGTPDVVLPKYRAVVFTSGCFWHHHTCRYANWPVTNEAFWRAKIGRTMERDRAARQDLEASGWRVATVWECALRDKAPHAVELCLDELADWLRCGAGTLELPHPAGAAETSSPTEPS